MASRALAALARGPEDYLGLRGGARGGGPAGDRALAGEDVRSALAGDWGSRDPARRGSAAGLIGRTEQGRRVKVSLLDEEREVALRRALPPGEAVHRRRLQLPVLGDDRGQATRCWGSSTRSRRWRRRRCARSTGATCERTSRFLRPTSRCSGIFSRRRLTTYKTGRGVSVVAGRAPEAFPDPRAQAGRRSLPHLAEVFRLADTAGSLPTLTSLRRMSVLLTDNGNHPVTTARTGPSRRAHAASGSSCGICPGFRTPGFWRAIPHDHRAPRRLA